MTATVDHFATPAQMRHVLGHFATGVTIVTGMVGERRGSVPAGLACQSFTSVSLEPPLVLICVAHTSKSWPRIQATGRFSVNVLAADQQDVCARFARSGGEKFVGLGWRETAWGPVLDGVLASVQCDIEQVHRAGDHDVVIGRVRQLLTHRDGDPLLYFRGAFGLPA